MPPPALGAIYTSGDIDPWWCSDRGKARGLSIPARHAPEHDERLWDSGGGSLRHSGNLATFDPWPEQQKQRLGLCCTATAAVFFAATCQQRKSEAVLVRGAVRRFV